MCPGVSVHTPFGIVGITSVTSSRDSQRHTRTVAPSFTLAIVTHETVFLAVPKQSTAPSSKLSRSVCMSNVEAKASTEERISRASNFEDKSKPSVVVGGLDKELDRLREAVLWPVRLFL